MAALTNLQAQAGLPLHGPGFELDIAFADALLHLTRNWAALGHPPQWEWRLYVDLTVQTPWRSLSYPRGKEAFSAVIDHYRPWCCLPERRSPRKALGTPQPDDMFRNIRNIWRDRSSCPKPVRYGE